MIEIGTLLQDRYLIEKQIGAGGMGAVYLAVDQRFGSYVALKETFFTDDEFGEAFEREARLLNGLHHPVLPHVSDYFTENKGYFLVMQYIEGEDLSAILKREGAFPVKDVLRWTDNLLDALDYLHSQEPPVIHRDIKPQNLKLTPRGDVILLDFGLAKLKSEDTSGVKSVFGYSRKYSPLEQIQGTGTDARSDIFSLGATAYHLLTGKPPLDVLARASEIVVGNPDPLKLASEINSEVPVSIANALNSALALNPAARFVSANAMRQALENAQKIDSPNIVEELPENVLPIVSAEEKVISSAEDENFPALEAFAAAEAVNNKPITEQIDEAKAMEIPISAESSLPKPEVLPQVSEVVESPTRVALRKSNSKIPAAALVALLICVGLAAGYFINKANSASKINQTAAAAAPTLQAIPEKSPESEQSAIASESPATPISESPKIENINQAKTKSVPIEKTVEKENTALARETVNEKTAQKESVKPVQSETATNKTRVRTPIRNQPQPRVVESEQVPDIESIFTGKPAANPDEKIQRRQRGEITDEELREIRRQRREERRRRQNRNNFPF